MEPSILIACVGNIFLGDDAFGVEVAQRLLRTSLPSYVLVRDFGIRSYDLAYALMDNWDLVILVDAVSLGRSPGTVYTIEPEMAGDSGEPATVDAHTMNPASVLRLVHALGGSVGRMLLVGCEPATVEPDNSGQLGLSPPVSGAVDKAVRVIQELLIKNNHATAA